MNTLDDLRATLVVHAPGNDAALPDRVDSVHARVRVVRRRRGISAAVGAVAAVAVVVAGVAVPRLTLDHGEPALSAATTVTVGGFEYGLVKEFQSRPGQQDLKVEVPHSPRDQVVVLLADHLHGGVVALGRASSDDPTDTLDRLVDDGAGAPVAVWADDPTESSLAARVDGGDRETQVGVAVYRRTEAMPEGIVDPTGSSVFRENVGGRHLLTAAFAEPGQAERTLRFTGALAEVRLSEFCSVPGGGDSTNGGAWIHVSIDGDGFTSGECGAPAEDASRGTSYYPDLHEVGQHVARVWISRTEGGAPVQVPGAVLGLGVYGPAETVEVHGSTLDKVVEFDGRRWELDAVVESEPGAHRIVGTWNDLREHLLVGYATEGTRRVTTGGTLPGAGSVNRTGLSAAETRASSLSGVLLPGEQASYTVTWPATYADASGALLVYRPADGESAGRSAGQ